MKLKPLFAAALLAASFGSALAEDLTPTITLSGTSPNWTAGFSLNHMLSGEFHDTITFIPSVGTSFVDASLITIGFYPSNNIDFYDAALNSSSLSLSSAAGGMVEAGGLLHAIEGGSLVLHVHGFAGAAGGDAGLPINAQYAGTMNINPVPEPATYGMLIGGLGILGFLSRRRKQS